MFHVAQVLQRDVAGIILIEILTDPADALGRQFVAAVEAHDHVLVEREQVEILVEMLDDIHHQVQTFALVVEVLEFVLQKELQHQFPQQLVALVVDLLRIGAVASLGEVREVVGQVFRAHVDLRDDVVPGHRLHPVHFVPGIGKDIACVQVIIVIAVFQFDLALQHVDELDIRVIVKGILHEICDIDMDRIVIRVIQSFQQHIGILQYQDFTILCAMGVHENGGISQESLIL